VPSAVTWDSASSGWILGPAGTPGKCANANPDICTSVARTSDGGRTWRGRPAPDTGGPEAATGVTGLRFLNATYGWAFGPELWATADGGSHWHQVPTGGASVTDLETMNGRAYALFGSCAAPAGGGDTIAGCTSYTLETAAAGSDAFSPVAGVPAGLAPTSTGKASAVIALAGAAGRQPAAGYLVAPDGTLYAGPLDGGAWHRAAALPCAPGAARADGLPQGVVLATDRLTTAGARRLALVCLPAPGQVVAYLSGDNGVTWSRQAAATTAAMGAPQSLTTLPGGTLILATRSTTTANGGIYQLFPGGQRWQAATLSDPSGQADGFSYVGMTSATQGVALGGSPDLHGIWMTTDEGRTWQVRPIKG